MELIAVSCFEVQWEKKEDDHQLKTGVHGHGLHQSRQGGHSRNGRRGVDCGL